MDNTNLTNHLLIAMPSLADPNFSHTVTYLCEHNENGAMGIVINRPIDIKVGEVLEQMQIPVGADAPVAQLPVFLGGPVEEQRGFVLHSSDSRWESTLRINDQVSVTTSRDILEAMARGEGPAHALVALGYAGWGPGQLEQEILDNSWLSAPADQAILFELPPAKRWEAAAKLLGVDLDLLSTDAGHA
ncbi:MAG TPA: YqgE/AlgH family protein [Gammaproteobacteria bacterium]|nr:YqgE/AlgH family protein [Gammaproteobacteria bacterium]